jgi:hypothetical protein
MNSQNNTQETEIILLVILAVLSSILLCLIAYFILWKCQRRRERIEQEIVEVMEARRMKRTDRDLNPYPCSDPALPETYTLRQGNLHGRSNNSRPRTGGESSRVITTDEVAEVITSQPLPPVAIHFKISPQETVHKVRGEYSINSATWNDPLPDVPHVCPSTIL